MEQTVGRKIVTGVSVLLAVLALLWLVFGPVTSAYRQRAVAGAVERVRLLTPGGQVDVVAKLDTGADISSIDESLARSLGLSIDTSRRKRVITETGVRELPTVRFTFVLGDRQVTTEAIAANRSQLSTPMVIGKPDLDGLVVDASAEFLTEPGQFAASLFRFLSPQQTSIASALSKVIIIIPVLGTMIVLLRLLAGVRTFGIFGPVVISLSLLEIGVFPGVAIYALLVSVAIAAKMLLLDRLKLPQVAELSLVMFILVLTLSGVAALPVGFGLSFTAAFFPLVITSYLVERATRTIEEEGPVELAVVMTATFAAAVVLSVLGAYLVSQPMTVVWIAFAAAVFLSVAAGNYLGLRLTELVRFRFLRRTHRHE